MRARLSPGPRDQDSLNFNLTNCTQHAFACGSVADRVNVGSHLCRARHCCWALLAHPTSPLQEIPPQLRLSSALPRRIQEFSPQPLWLRSPVDLRSLTSYQTAGEQQQQQGR